MRFEHLMRAAGVLSLAALLLAACSQTSGDEALAQAAKQGDVAAVEKLLQGGADVNAVDSTHQVTALM